MICIHGGPGAPGYMAPVAREIAARPGMERLVLEPWQRPSSDKWTLSVELHISDLLTLLREHPGLRGRRPVLLGSSWGAMLALCVAARVSESLAGVILVGCGTFDQASRDEFKRRLAARTDESVQARIAAAEALADPDARLSAKADAMLDAYSYDLISRDTEIAHVDARANRESWDDMLRLQGEGVYPAAFAGVTCPLLMVNGDVDPHPGDWIARGLADVIPAWRDPAAAAAAVVTLARCGHYPWLERHGRMAFYEAVGGLLEGLESSREKFRE